MSSLQEQIAVVRQMVERSEREANIGRWPNVSPIMRDVLATLEGLAAPGEMLRDRPELTALIAKSRAAYEAMSPEEREAHDKAQRDSWVRGNIELDRLERAEQATRRFIAPADAPDGAG